MTIRRQLAVPVLVAIWAGSASAETVSEAKFTAGKNDYACSVAMTGSAGTGLSISLSDYKDVWKLIFFVTGNPDEVLPYFGDNGLVDNDRFSAKIPEVQVGGTAFRLTKAMILAVQRSDVDKETPSILELETRHRVAAALDAMQKDGISFGRFATLSQTTKATAEFRACSLAALGLAPGEAVEVDFREEYRLVFEPSFKSWVAAMARAESCLVARFDDAEIESVAEKASSAFYPGVLNTFKRRAYKEGLIGDVPFSKLAGSVDAISDGCLMAEGLVDLSRLPVESAIKAAEDTD